MADRALTSAAFWRKQVKKSRRCGSPALFASEEIGRMATRLDLRVAQTQGGAAVFVTRAMHPQHAISRCDAGCCRAADACSAELQTPRATTVAAECFRSRATRINGQRSTARQLICVAVRCHAALPAPQTCPALRPLLNRSVTRAGNMRSASAPPQRGTKKREPQVPHVP